MSFSPNSQQMEEIGEKVLSAHIVSGRLSPKSSEDELNSLNQAVLELNRVLRCVAKQPSEDQFSEIEMAANKLSGILNNVKKGASHDPKIFPKLFEAYKSLSCALLLIRKNNIEYGQKYKQLKREYDILEKLHKSEINSLKNQGFKVTDFADQINDSKKELHYIRSQYEQFKKFVDKTVSSIQIMMQLPESTTLKTLKSEINAKLKQIKQAPYSSDSEVSGNYNKYLEQEKEMNKNLRKQIKEITDQCISVKQTESQIEDENRRLRDSIIMHENQINSLLREKADLQKALDNVSYENNELKQNNEMNNQMDKIFLMQTDLNSVNLKYNETIEKIKRLKEKLKKANTTIEALKQEKTTLNEKMEELELNLQQTKLENEELNNESRPKPKTNSTANNSINLELENKNLNLALDQLLSQFSSQSEELANDHEMRQKLIYFISLQSQIISEFSDKSSSIESQLKSYNAKFKEQDLKLSEMKKISEENENLKSFLREFEKKVSYNLTPDHGEPVIKGIHNLEPDSLDILFLFNNQLPTEEVIHDNFHENSINTRLFQYIEDQINILNNIANNDLINKTSSSNILHSCEEADKFVKEIAPDFYNEPSIFSSFGLFVDPSLLSSSLRSFLSIFKEVTSPESRELFDIAKQAIAMNSLLRNIALLMKKESEKVHIELQKNIENLSEMRETETYNSETRINDLKKQLNEALKQKESESEKLDSLTKFIRKLKAENQAPAQLIKFIESGCKDNIYLNEDILPSNANNNSVSQENTNNTTSPQTELLTEKAIKEFEVLKQKYAKLQKVNKSLKDKISILLKKNEKLKNINSSVAEQVNDEKEILKNSITDIQVEYEKQQEATQEKIAKMKEKMKKKLEEQQEIAIKETAIQVERMRVEFKSQLKQKSAQLKEKLKKANEICDNQIQRADNLRNHYESLLQNLRKKLDESRKTELQNQNDYNNLETESKELKSKIASLMVDNKMLNIKIKSLEDKQKRDNSLIENQTKVKQIAADSKLEEKIHELERNNSYTITRMREILSTIYNTSIIQNISNPLFATDHYSFEDVENSLKAIAVHINKLNLKISKLNAAQDEISRIRSYLLNIETNTSNSKPGTMISKLSFDASSTFAIVAESLKSLKLEIENLKYSSTIGELWRKWASEILGKQDEDSLMMNDINALIHNQRVSKTYQSSNTIPLKKELTPQESQKYVKTLINAMESIGQKSPQHENPKNWPIIPPV